MVSLVCLYSYEMMSRCWLENPDIRPCFSEISRFLDMLLNGQTSPPVGSADDDGYTYSRSLTQVIPDDYLVSSLDSDYELVFDLVPPVSDVQTAAFPDKVHLEVEMETSHFKDKACVSGNVDYLNVSTELSVTNFTTKL